MLLIDLDINRNSYKEKNIMAKVLVIADIKQGVLKGSTTELLSKAKAMGAETAVVAIGSGISKRWYPDLAKAGSDTQYIADDPGLELFSAGPYAACCRGCRQQFGADLIWFGFSESGKAVAPRVAAQLDAPCATEITDVTLDGDQIEVIRPAITNKVMQRVKINTAKLVAVVRAGAFEAARKASPAENVIKLSPPATDLKAVCQGSCPMPAVKSIWPMPTSSFRWGGAPETRPVLIWSKLARRSQRRFWLIARHGRRRFHGP
jgi:electron transfer flavoprotein alpha subunit